MIFVKPRPHQQQCRSNIVECYNVECCFDIVASVDRALAVYRSISGATYDMITCIVHGETRQIYVTASMCADKLLTTSDSE